MKKTTYADIIIYGDGIQAVAAAETASQIFEGDPKGEGKKIVLIAPNIQHELGGMSTSVGKNLFEVRNNLENGLLYQGGSFYNLYNGIKKPDGTDTTDIPEELFEGMGKYFSTSDMSNRLKRYIGYHKNISVIYGKDIQSVTCEQDRISEIKLREIGRVNNDTVWGYGRETVAGNANAIFIDASEEGRLTRLSGVRCVTGRGDWTNEDTAKLADETGSLGRQQAATLMIKLKGINPVEKGDMLVDKDKLTGVKCCYGGLEKYRDPNGAIQQINHMLTSLLGCQFCVSPIVAVQDGPDSDEWWADVIQVFNVDARARNKDKGTDNYPKDMIPGVRSYDDAYITTCDDLKVNKSSILAALRQFDGFENVDFATNSNGTPKVGKMLYIRESIHTPSDPDKMEAGADRSNYALTLDESYIGGVSSESGYDLENYKLRIGIGFGPENLYPYTMDETLKNGYAWEPSLLDVLRHDLRPPKEIMPKLPVYIPSGVLKTNQKQNLLLAGYALNMASFSLGELRTVPNLCVMADMAGIIAAGSVLLKSNVQTIIEDEKHIAMFRKISNKLMQCVYEKDESAGLSDKH